MHRSEYGSLESYINTLRSNIIKCNQIDMGISYYQAALLLLDEASNELPNWTIVNELHILEDNPDKYTQEQFFKLCNDTIERSRQTEPQYAATKLPNKDPKKQGEPKRRGFPSKGKDHAKWAEELRNKTPAKNGNRCGHCNTPFHGRHCYYYLNADKRTQTGPPNLIYGAISQITKQ